VLYSVAWPRRSLNLSYLTLVSYFSLPFIFYFFSKIIKLSDLLYVCYQIEPIRVFPTHIIQTFSPNSHFHYLFLCCSYSYILFQLTITLFDDYMTTYCSHILYCHYNTYTFFASFDILYMFTPHKYKLKFLSTNPW
jgi:hypothetical protein